jgi:hypothetical protein
VDHDAAVDAPPDAAADATLPDGAPGTARKKLIKIDHNRVAGTVTAFPVWIRLDNDADLMQRASSSGADIFFTTEAGAPLEFDLQTWSKASGTLQAWVRTDLSNSTDTKLYLRYGDAGPAHAPDPLLAFSSSFAAVWHMDDSLATSTVIADALGQRNGTAVNGPTSKSNATLGRGITFDGADDRVTFTNPISGDKSTTISAWVDVAAPQQGFSSVMTVGNNATGQSRFLHTKYPNVAIGLYGSDLQPANSGIDGQGPKLVHWVYAANGNAGNTTLYINGVVVATMNHGGTINTTGTMGFLGYAPPEWGPGGTTTSPLKGTLDEVRIATTPRSQAWVSTEYANQSSPGTFYSVDSEQPFP